MIACKPQRRETICREEAVKVLGRLFRNPVRGDQILRRRHRLPLPSGEVLAYHAGRYYVEGDEYEGS